MTNDTRKPREFEEIYNTWIERNGSRSPSIQSALGWMYSQVHADFFVPDQPHPSREEMLKAIKGALYCHLPGYNECPDHIAEAVMQSIEGANPPREERAEPPLSPPTKDRGEEKEFEYTTTQGPRKAWDGSPDLCHEGWEPVRWDRFDYHEERIWRRKKESPLEGRRPDEGVSGKEINTAARAYVEKMKSPNGSVYLMGDEIEMAAFEAGVKWMQALMSIRNNDEARVSVMAKPEIVMGMKVRVDPSLGPDGWRIEQVRRDLVQTRPDGTLEFVDQAIRIRELERERDAYKKAKEENDERFQLRIGDLERENAELRAKLAGTLSTTEEGR